MYAPRMPVVFWLALRLQLAPPLTKRFLAIWVMLAPPLLRTMVFFTWIPKFLFATSAMDLAIPLSLGKGRRIPTWSMAGGLPLTATMAGVMPIV